MVLFLAFFGICGEHKNKEDKHTGFRVNRLWVTSSSGSLIKQGYDDYLFCCHECKMRRLN